MSAAGVARKSAPAGAGRLSAGVGWTIELRCLQLPVWGAADVPPTLDWCRQFVGGPVQLYELQSMDMQLLLHEEGKVLGMPLNRIASAIMQTDLMHQLGRPPLRSELDFVAGPALVLGGIARWT